MDKLLALKVINHNGSMREYCTHKLIILSLFSQCVSQIKFYLLIPNDSVEFSAAYKILCPEN